MPKSITSTLRTAVLTACWSVVGLTLLAYAIIGYRICFVDVYRTTLKSGLVVIGEGGHGGFIATQGGDLVCGHGEEFVTGFQDHDAWVVVELTTYGDGEAIASRKWVLLSGRGERVWECDDKGLLYIELQRRGLPSEVALNQP